ncbi:FAD dependent oxidoreductase [Colletotrichum karsti]|uniref:6-methylsalicylate decarboxylase n=1 Tax=Colletotrichum karsti TaxID=1095194 RepID=A0A9P6I8R3_9PEZI|nr:FAD dependent oxidoreductase [Colletotrichum karsti]KAF9878433.1 FAD dependent oxidoreductase [Colletotrichum karsti]
MKSLRVTGPGEISWVDIPQPKAGPNDVLLKMKACGICGSDSLYEEMGGVPPRRNCHPLGHEPAAEVVAVGKDIAGRDVDVGDHVVIDTFAFADGMFGSGGAQGGFSEYVVVRDYEPRKQLRKIPSHVPWHVAALNEPMAVALHAVNRTDPKPGSKVVIFGAGPIGLGCIMAYRRRDVGHIVVVDVVDAKLETAMKLGADAAVNSLNVEDLAAKLIELQGEATTFWNLGKRPATDIFMDAAGAPPIPNQILGMAKRAATFGIVGVQKKPTELHLGQIIIAEPNIVFCMGYPTEIFEVTDDLAENWEKYAEIVSDQIPFSQAKEALELAKSGKANKKSLLNMRTFSPFSVLLLAAGAVLATNQTTKIDTHAHYVPDFYAQALRDAGHVPGPDGMPGIPDWDPETHLQFMQRANIAKSYLSISSPGVYLSVPSKVATENATKLARRVNEYASQLKAKYPKKFGFFASLPLPDVQGSLKEIEYAFTKLDPKPDGIVLMSNFYGMYLGDPDLDPVYKALNALNVTIFEHPTTPCTEANHLKYHINGTDSKVTPKEWQALNRPASGRLQRAPNLDFPFDTARTFQDLFYSRVPTRFPNIKWIIPHAGGGLIPTIDRLINYSPPEDNVTEAGVKETLARSFYFDLTGPWPVTWAIPALMRWVSYEKLVWGSDTPFTPWATALAGAAQFDKQIDEVFNDPKKAKAVRRGNAKKIFG